MSGGPSGGPSKPPVHHDRGRLGRLLQDEKVCASPKGITRMPVDAHKEILGTISSEIRASEDVIPHLVTGGGDAYRTVISARNLYRLVVHRQGFTLAASHIFIVHARDSSSWKRFHQRHGNRRREVCPLSCAALQVSLHPHTIGIKKLEQRIVRRRNIAVARLLHLQAAREVHGSTVRTVQVVVEYHVFVPRHLGRREAHECGGIERALRERARPRTASHKQQREYDVAKPSTMSGLSLSRSEEKLLDVVVPCGADLGSIRFLGRRRPVTCLYGLIECGERIDDLHRTDIEDHVRRLDSTLDQKGSAHTKRDVERRDEAKIQPVRTGQANGLAERPPDGMGRDDHPLGAGDVGTRELRQLQKEEIHSEISVTCQKYQPIASRVRRDARLMAFVRPETLGAYLHTYRTQRTDSAT